MSQAEALFHLQEIDQNVLRMRRRLQEIATALGDDAVVAAAQQQVDGALAALTPLKTAQRSLELETRATAEKAQEVETTLYSGSVNNPKELQEMQAELNMLQQRKAELEERLLENMLTLEEAQAVVEQARTKLQTLSAERLGEKRHLLDEKEQLDTQMDALRQQRQAALLPVSPDILATYKQLMQQKNGYAVARLDGQSCSVCRIEQTMAIVQEVRRGKTLVFCLGCGRILL